MAKRDPYDWSNRGAHARPEDAGKPAQESTRFRWEIALIVFALLIGIAFIALQLPAQLANIGEPQAASSSTTAAGGSNTEADSSSDASASSSSSTSSSSAQAADPEALRAALFMSEDYRSGFVHGEKPAEFQKWIVLHDTESETPPEGIVEYWDASGEYVAAHFVVGVDGSIVQCVPLDKIAHHAGFGDAGHNVLFGVEDESRDDRIGTVPIGDWAPDYGMNSYSVGIELVHVGGSGYYPEEQLEALDGLIAYIDAYFGEESQITDHKAWRSGNSDTSPEFADYLANYQDHRTHDDAA